MASKTPSPWLFILAGLPYGVVGSFVTVVMGYLMRRAGMEVSAIGWASALLFVPTILMFLYAPIVDIGPKRKHWIVIVSVLGAVCLVIAFQMPLPEHTNAFLLFAFLAQLISGLVGCANGGILAVTMPDHKRGRAGAAWNIGNVSGGALAASIAIHMTSEGYDPLVIGLVLGGMMVIPSLAMLTIDEPPRDKIPIGALFATTWRDVRGVLFSRQGITGILLCMSPVGTAALANFFATIAVDYQASDDRIAFVSGPASVALTAVGALAGGFLCDRFNRRVMYLMSGALTAVCGLVMMVSPRSPDTYLYGAMTYALITGFCYSAFTATVLETIGKGGKAASTQYSLFTAAGNVAITYVGIVDTQFHERHGVEGVVGSDAALNLIGVAVLALVFWRSGAFGRWRHVEAPPTA